MRIIGFETFLVPPRWLFLKINTDKGISGWGEPIVEGKARTVEAAVKEFMSQLIGSDPSDIEGVWELMYRGSFYRGGPILMSAISGIDQALWDIKGKVFDAPIYQLLGGKVRNKIKTYSWIGGDRPQEVAGQALARKQAGFQAIKMNATADLQMVDSYEKIHEVVKRVASVRQICGPDLGIVVDFHGRCHKPMMKPLAQALDPYDLMFIEEPTLPQDETNLIELRSLIKTPIATGERLFSRWDYKSLIASHDVDVIQPDLCHAGGITECKKIASMAETYDIAVAFHCPLGPVALAACLQVDATVYNAFIQEQSLGIHYNAGNDLLDYVLNPEIFDFVDGYLNIPSGPGLGLQINEKYLREQSKLGSDWHNPIWRNEDGSIAEW